MPIERMDADPKQVPLPNAGTRVTQVALFLNAALHGTASVGMALGLGPHAADQPNMARRAAAAGVAGAFMLAVVARRLRRDPYLILMALVFVACNLAATVWEYVATHSPNNLALAPAIPESTFLIVYSAFVASRLRKRSAATSCAPTP